MTTARSWLVAVLCTVIDTPGMTAFCASVTVPESVALDCARAGDGDEERERDSDRGKGSKSLHFHPPCINS